ncbi:C-type lectin domain family 4 member G-like [Acanthopagrus schlegelii]
MEQTVTDCNTTHSCDDENQVTIVQDCERRMPCHCNKLQDRFNALTRERDQLRNEKSDLTNRIRKLVEERDRLLRELSSCVSSQQCLPDWRDINSRCYFLSTEQKTWENSRKYCQSKGADLVVINSEEEQRALYRMDGNQDLLFWIGLHNTTGTFKWVDGSALTKTFWQSGQPGDGGPNNKEQCVEMYHFNPVLANWNDAPCGHNRHWLCEKAPCTSP